MTITTTSSGASTTSTIRAGASASRLRLDLMYKLGVDVNGARSKEQHSLRQKQKQTRDVSLLGKVSLKQERLNDADVDYSDDDSDDDDDENSQNGSAWAFTSLFRPANSSSIRSNEADGQLSSSYSTETSASTCSDPSPLLQRQGSSGTASKRLAFDDTVTVCPIPKRDEYSERIRQQLWVPPDELMRNAQRNAIEFAAEGWDWKATLEDDEMYRCMKSNELIHPVHVECQQRREQQQQHGV
eukprot:CAMPEP_0119558378 /NCGR_PEP_ID=MMETSP1352-20130426/10749_1 /TAXON_ID=265584 /ORGANISM="Stauroneis constricta, Strain CCMP1120" /LENGTH=241 /DNA_ID=CAMNT_0007605723 /DNA_START=42 /DNA_END=767 /DNA_ORIENTATION=+